MGDQAVPKGRRRRGARAAVEQRELPEEVPGTHDRDEGLLAELAWERLRREQIVVHAIEFNERATLRGIVFPASLRDALRIQLARRRNAAARRCVVHA